MNLHIVTPLFAGESKDEALISRRFASWMEWLQTPGFGELQKVHRASIFPYYPGTEVAIPSDKDPNAIRLIIPPGRQTRVPKGLIARCHLLAVLERQSRSGDNPNNVVFGCIDGSGAFDFDCLKLLAKPFTERDDIDVVLGRRPADYSGMPVGRKEIEEFEQYLLLRFRPEHVKVSLPGYDLASGILPDGQAGCWGFRLSAASRLPLTASGYELEFDLLASAVEAGLRIEFTEPLLMPRKERHSSANASAIEMSINKLRFVEQKLRITRRDILESWLEFRARFAGTERIENILPGYEDQLLRFCKEALRRND